MAGSSHLSFRMMLDDEAPVCGALIVDCVVQRRGKYAINGCPQKIASVWGSRLQVTAQKPCAMVMLATDPAQDNIQGVLASATVTNQDRTLEIEHFYTLKSPEPIGKSMVAYMLLNAHDVDVIKVNSARGALSFYKEQIGFKRENGALAKELFLRRNAQGVWDVTPEFAEKFMQANPGLPKIKAA